MLFTFQKVQWKVCWDYCQVQFVYSRAEGKIRSVVGHRHRAVYLFLLRMRLTKLTFKETVPLDTINAFLGVFHFMYLDFYNLSILALRKVQVSSRGQRWSKYKWYIIFPLFCYYCGYVMWNVIKDLNCLLKNTMRGKLAQEDAVHYVSFFLASLLPLCVLSLGPAWSVIAAAHGRMSVCFWASVLSMIVFLNDNNWVCCKWKALRFVPTTISIKTLFPSFSCRLINFPIFYMRVHRIDFNQSSNIYLTNINP